MPPFQMIKTAKAVVIELYYNTIKLSSSIYTIIYGSSNSIPLPDGKNIEFEHPCEYYRSITSKITLCSVY